MRTQYPPGLKGSGKALYKSVTDAFELEVHENLLLIECARTADRLDAIAEELAGQPLVRQNAKGDLVLHPAAIEGRQLGLAMAKMVASLRLPDVPATSVDPDGNDADVIVMQNRTQHRQGFRGPRSAGASP